MSLEQYTAPSSDIRSASRQHQRDVENRHKWSRGALLVRGRNPIDQAHQKPTPKSIQSHSLKPLVDRMAYVKSRDSCKSQAARKLDMLSAHDGLAGPDDSVTTDSSVSTSDEDVAETTGPLPDDGVMYSFDSHRGPTNGSQVLGAVLAQAIEQYQDKETTQLVLNEYELVNADGDSFKARPGKKGRLRIVKKREPKEDEDYEFL